MELDDTWDPDPLPNGNPRNQSHPRSNGQTLHNSQAQVQYYESSQNSHLQQNGRNAYMDLYDHYSDDESSSNEYPVVLQQSQINHKRMKSPAQPMPDRRKRHQSEHPSGVGRGRTTNVEEAMYDHNQVISQSRHKSVARNDIQYKAAENNYFDGYRNVENAMLASRKPIARSHSRARDFYKDQDYRSMEDYNEQFARQPKSVESQDNGPKKRRFKEEPIFVSVPPNKAFHGSTGRSHQNSSGTYQESRTTPKPKLHEYSTAQSVAPTNSYDDGRNFYPGTKNGVSNVVSQRRRQEHQLRSPLWSNIDPAIQKPPPAQRLQRSIDMPASMNPIPHTPKDQSVRSRSVAPNRTQKVASQPRGYDYDPIDDDDVNETPLEDDLRGRSKSQLKTNSSPMDLMNALSKSSAFKSSNSRATNEVYQTPSRSSNRATDSGTIIDLVTPDSAVSARGPMPFIPQNWAPVKRSSIKVSTPLTISTQNGSRVNNLQQPAESSRQRQAAGPSASDVQRLAEDDRQRRAAEKTVRQELNADRQTLQIELFGDVVSETEEEKRERDEAKRLEAQKIREEHEKKLAIAAEEKRKRAELRAEEKAAEQLIIQKKEAEKKARRAAEFQHQSLRAEQNAEERRKVANELFKAKKERDAAVQKAVEEQRQILEKEKREQAQKTDQLERNLKRLAAQVEFQKVALLKSARKSKTENGTKSSVDTSASPVAPPTDMEIDEGSSLSMPIVNGNKISVDVPSTQATLPTNMEIDGDVEEDSLFVPETLSATIVPPGPDTSNKLSIPQNSDTNPAILQSIEQDRVPASMAEVFANMTSNSSGNNVVEDREAEREAIRKKSAEERTAVQRKRGKSVPAEPSPKTPARKEPPRATSKAPSKATPKKKCSHPSAKSPANSVFSTKLKPLHGPNDIAPPVQSKQPETILEKPSVELPPLKPRPIPQPLPPPPPPPPTRPATKPETRFISGPERDRIEADRERILEEAKARNAAVTKQRADARKDELVQKRTFDYRKKKEKEFRDKARKDGKELGEFELEAMLNKLMAEREKRKQKRRNQRRSGEKTSSTEHEHEHESAPSPTLHNASNTAVPQVSSSDTASESNHLEEEEDPEVQSRREHEARTAASMKALALSRAARQSQPVPVEHFKPLFSDSSDESEEDPDDEETTERLRLHAERVAAAKAAEKANEVQPATQIGEELALEQDIEALFEEELVIEGEPAAGSTALNPDDYDTQIVEPMPPYFQGSSAQRSSNNQSANLGANQIVPPPPPDKPRKPVSYKMVNVYMVMTQLTLHEHEDEATLKKKFFDVDKANKYAQTLVNEYRTKKFMQQEIVEKWDKEYKYSCKITHDNHKVTRVFVKVVPMNPKDIDKYDPREIHPKFANKYYTVRFEKLIEQLDPETKEVRMAQRTVGFADASKLYTVLEMANHAAAEYLLSEIKPKEEFGANHGTYNEELVPQVREGRDFCTQEDQLFFCELESSESVPWAEFKTLKVEVEMSTTEGPIN